MKFRAHHSSSAGNFYTVSDGSAVLALECGVSMSKIRRALDGLRHTVTDLDGCLVTHSHADHCSAARSMMRASVNVYASRETFADLRLEGHRARPVAPLAVVDVGPWRVLPFCVPHDAEGSLGFLVLSPTDQKILFVMDTAYIPNQFVGVHVIAIECNYATDLLRESRAFTRRRVLKHHMSLGRVKDFLEETDLSKTREIHLLHVSDSHGDADRFRHEVEAATGIPTYVAPR